MRAAVAEAATTAQQLHREMEARAVLEQQLQQQKQQTKQDDHSFERNLLASIQDECNAIFNRQRGVLSSPAVVVSPTSSSCSSWADADRTLTDLEALVGSLTNK